MNKKSIIIITVLITLAVVGILFKIKETLEYPYWGYFTNTHYEIRKEAIQFVIPRIEMHKLREGVYPKKT